MALPILDGNQTAATLSTVLTSGEHIPAHTVVSLGSQAITDVRGAVSGSVVSISNFPTTQTVAGAVTANGYDGSNAVYAPIPLNDGASAVNVRVEETNGSIPISGTVTANVNLISDQAGGNSPVVFGVPGADVNTIRTVIYSSANSSFGNDQGAPVDSENPLPISGTVTANVGSILGFNEIYLADADNDTRFSSSYPFPISGTVTANNPNGALTTRFGSVATANLAFITSAVTNTSRKYLLAQNISAGTVTIGIGFSPTTTQGIQLTAGAGLTFDSFCPTGAVFWLGAVTGAAFTILEG